MNIECRIVENRDIQLNASLSPRPVWKMDLYLFKHDENLFYTCDRYSLICLLTNSAIARHMVMKPVLCLDTLPSPQYGMRAMLGRWIWHCTSLWLRTTLQLHPKHLHTAYAIMTQTALWLCPKHESLHTFCKTHDTYKNCLKCWIIPNMCHMAALRRTKRYILKHAHNRALPDWNPHNFQKVTVFWKQPQISKLQLNLTSSCGTLKACLLSLITFAMHVV